MIFNLRIFKKLIKEAYKGTGLFVKREAEEYALYSARWIIRIKNDAFIKEYKAAVIEHIGDLPTLGKTIKASDYWGIEEIEPSGRIEKLPSTEELADTYKPVWLSRVYIERMGKLHRVLEGENQNMLMPAELVSLVEDAKVEDDKPLEGPFSTPLQKGILHWYNRECHYSATIIDTDELTKERAILEALRAVELG